MNTVSDFLFNVLFPALDLIVWVLAPVFIIGVGLLVFSIDRSTKAFANSEDFRRMNASQKDIPQDAVKLPVNYGPGESSVYIAGTNVFLPESIVTNQSGTAMREAGMKYLRLDLRSVTELTCLTVGSGGKGAIGYMLFTVPNMPKVIAVYSRRGLGDPPPELFDTGKFFELAGRSLGEPVKDLGPQRFWQLLKYM